MENTFHDIQDAQIREAYVRAELTNGLAHQIRIIRQQRGWSQKQFADKLGTTQTTVSRLEDPSYGRYNISSLLSVSKVFDVALFVRYLPFSKFVPSVWDTSPDNFEAAAYVDEVDSFVFFDEKKDGVYFKTMIENKASECYSGFDLYSSNDDILNLVAAIDINNTYGVESVAFEYKFVDE